MRFVSFEGGWGALEGQEVIELTDRFPSLLAMIEAGGAAAPAGPRRPLASLTLREPIPGAGRIFCVGANYPKRHPLGGEVSGPAHPAIFQKPAETLVPHGAALLAPTASEQFDYEGELAVVIGRGGHRIAERDALGHVFGYTCLNDGSVRDFQKQSLWAGKNFWRSGSIGPCIATGIADPATLTLVTRLNGAEVQRSSVGRMFFSVPAIIAYLSAVQPLLPGDIIATGSPEGSGATRTPPRWLRRGDRLEIEIQPIGILANSVA